MKIDPIDQDYNPLGEEWPRLKFRLPDQNIVTLDVNSDSRLSEWSYFWLEFCTCGVRPAWYRVVENGKSPSDWRPLKSVKRVLKQTAVDDDDEDPAEARRERKGKVGAADKLAAGQYLLEVKIGGDHEYELAGVAFKVNAPHAKPAPRFSLTQPRCSASAVASLTKLPRLAVSGLDLAAQMGNSDLYAQYLRVNGHPVAEFPWPAIMLVTLLPYLHEKHQITLTKSEHDKLAVKITEARRTPQFFFTETHRKAFLGKLDGPFPEQKMRDYFREYNGVDAPDAGRMMLDGIRALRQSLSSLDQHSVILFSTM